MNLPPIDRNATPEQVLDGLEQYITAANTMLDAGNMVDLAGLDAVVDALCARVLTLDADAGRAFADKFDALHASLGALQEKMVATQTQIGQELQQTNARQKASRAYMKDNK